MPRLTTLALVVVLVASAAGPALAATEGSPDISVHLPDNRVTAGEETTLDLYLLNGGRITSGGPASEESEVTTARNVTVTVDAGDAPIEVRTGTRPVGNVPEGRVGPIQFAIAVNESAQPGRYAVPVTVAYDHTTEIDSSDPTDVTRETEAVTRELTATLVVEERARFVAVNTTTDAAIGASGDVSITLENVGSATATSARVALRSTDGALTFGAGPTAQVFVGEWPAGERRTVTVNGQFAAGMDVRPVPVVATVTFEGDRRTHESDPLVAGVTPRSEPSFELSNVTSTLAVGDEGTLRGTITNAGGTPVRNAVVVFESENPTVAPVETEFAVGDLGPGESATFAFKTEVSDAADAGPRQLSLVVRYRDSGDEVRRSDPIDVRVEVASRRDRFTVEPVTQSIDAGASGVLELRVTNAGTEPVSAVSAKLFTDDPLSSSDDEAFVDRLAPGEATTIRFELSVAPDALAKRYPVSVDFQYDDADGDTRLSNTHRVPVAVTAPADGGGPSTVVVGGALVAALAAIGGLWYWRRR